MSSSLQSQYAAQHANRPSVINVGMPAGIPPASTAPAGLFASGTKVQVGNHRVVIERYLSEGGFAHVYLVKLPQPIDGEDVAVLKRVAVPDKEALANMRTEVETMKKLKGHRHIVKYIDSHASQLKGGGYEVFLLMEYCNGGGLIDFMNTRLQNRLTEPEIIKIISDVAQGVACMHYLKPPLLHRDLKVENVLISTKTSSKQFKLCDFGSAAPPRPAATNAAEGRLIEDDVQRHTTMQYRSPEMIDVYRKQPIDEKSDVWALGVLLYKLCYYTTPFEERGQMAILNASFKFPGYPVFSDRLKKLIAMMLQENPKSRPNIYQVVKEICSMRGIDVPIKDIYVTRTASEVRRNQELPSTPAAAMSPPAVGAHKAFPLEEKRSIPDITPMRRGRPNTHGTENASKPNPSPLGRAGNDPFAALDGSKIGTVDSDELSNRFPSLDQFSLLHDAGNKFAFESRAVPVPSQSAPVKELSQRVTEALADDAFIQPTKNEAASRPPPKTPILSTDPVITKIPQSIEKVDTTSHKPVASLIHSMNAGTQTDPTSPKIPKKPATTSIGTMTSPQITDYEREIQKFPTDLQRSPSQQRTPVTAPIVRELSEKDLREKTRPIMLDNKISSQTTTYRTLQTPQTARPSMEAMRIQPGEDDTLTRTKSEATRHRPLSAQFSTSRFAALRSSSTSRADDSVHPAPSLDDEPINISSDIEFLKKMEENDDNKRKEKRQSSGSKYGKLSLSGTKNLFAGRFGDAFKRFESGQSEEPEMDNNNNLTPIAGSVATDGRSDDGEVLEETEQMPPEVRRELERRRLSQEERRVAEAAAAYKQRVAENGTARGRENTRASLIQNKVQSLLEESNKSPTKTAEGYGRFTHSAPPEMPPSAVQPQSSIQPPLRKPTVLSPKQPASISDYPSIPPASSGPSSRPSAPPKPQILRTGGNIISPAPSPNVVSKPSHLVSQSSTTNSRPQPAGASQDSALSPEDWEAQFSKRYPSLSGLEMVETEISSDGRVIRDV